MCGGIREVGHAVGADALGELQARRQLLGSALVGMNPAGSRALHAPIACCHAALLGFSGELYSGSRRRTCPTRSGPGTSLTPLLRMHSANFTAFS